MATPADHIDLALGFSLTEGILAAPSEIEDLDIVRHEDSVELRVLLTSDRGDRLRRGAGGWLARRVAASAGSKAWPSDKGSGRPRSRSSPS
ncbi:formate dehydrogenase accessory sulfurtransferase FdhD [Bradyrhizobium sp. LA6.12]|uniref:formate dehydrogenase accessory sulfurtransferase FdhD n=1 Tax=unclassified Bradyrhizobium TaxID=2631580 RepID=UPI003394165B